MLLGSRTATRDLVACGFPDAPGGTPSALRAAGRESGFEIDRFVIIFYSVMICRLAFEAIIRVFRGVCRPEGRMVDALADSTDEGRLRMR